jgi:sulfopyruvate decarboxylase alpha subunit
MNSSKDSVFNRLDDTCNEKTDEIHYAFIDCGVNFVSGVPCGVLKHIIRNFEQEKDVIHVPVNRESEAVGLATGAYLGGKAPVVYMQNSGLFSASNDIASLLVSYEIPVFFVVSYRGCTGETAVQHFVTGGATENLLKSFNLPYVVYSGEKLNLLIKEMFVNMIEKQQPIFLLLKRGWQK